MSNKKRETGFNVASIRVGLDARPFVIAEMSGNHNQSLERALQIVDAAAETGVQALKIQTYTADTMTLNLKTRGFVIDDPRSLWHGRSLYDLYQEAHTPWEWHAAIFERCRKHGMIGFSTPFDETAVDFLESLNVPLYKVASFECGDIALLKKIASTGKPIIVSTGMATVSEMEETVSTLRKSGCENFAILKCTSNYPSSPENTNLRTIPHMRDLFRCEVGLSDHTFGIGAAAASVAMGATVIEKHFTLARADGGVDSAFSLEPHEMKSLVVETERAWQALGGVQYGPTDSEAGSLAFRRSLYVVAEVEKGQIFSKENLRAIRPGFGAHPRELEAAMGRRANRKIERGTPFHRSMIEHEE